MLTITAFIKAIDNESSPIGLAMVVALSALVLGAVYVLGRRAS